MGRLLAVALLAGAALCGCTSIGPSPPPAPAATASPLPHYRCDHNIEFTVRFADDTATVDAGARGSEQLLRDAGGVTPQQTVYSNPRLRAEFGLGASGGEALLHYLSPPMEMHCVRVAAP
jgi:hypothetical protein